jgi:hypothetical protein
VRRVLANAFLNMKQISLTDCTYTSIIQIHDGVSQLAICGGQVGLGRTDFDNQVCSAKT